jgi:nicotinamidase-related amidase
MTAPAVNPTRTALINVDMQECFVEHSPLAAPDGPAVLEQINRLAAACRAAGVLVVHTRGWMRPGRANVGAVMADLVPPFSCCGAGARSGRPCRPRELAVAPDPAPGRGDRDLE